MAYKVFTNGSVLNASEINENLMRQSVMVFSNAAARTAAITSPVEGMLTWLEDVNRYESYNGSAWVAAFPLTPIVTQTIGSGVTSVTVSNCFSSAFDNYRVMVSGTSISVSGSQFGLSFNNASGSTYFWAGRSQIYDGSNTFSGNNNVTTAQAGVFGNNSSSLAMIDIGNPFLASQTSFKTIFTSNAQTGEFGGSNNQSVSHTGFSIFTFGPTLTGGVIQVFGYRKG